jgi:hypothetical protein
MRGLKALVVGLGVLVLIGMAVVVVTIANRIGDGGPPADRAAPAERPAGTPRFAPATVAVPRDARVVETVVGVGRIIVRLDLPGGRTRLVVIDAATGREAGAVDLVPAAE